MFWQKLAIPSQFMYLKNIIFVFYVIVVVYFKPSDTHFMKTCVYAFSAVFPRNQILLVYGQLLVHCPGKSRKGFLLVYDDRVVCLFYWYRLGRLVMHFNQLLHR